MSKNAHPNQPKMLAHPSSPQMRRHSVAANMVHLSELDRLKLASYHKQQQQRTLPREEQQQYGSSDSPILIDLSRKPVMSGASPATTNSSVAKSSPASTGLVDLTKQTPTSLPTVDLVNDPINNNHAYNNAVRPSLPKHTTLHQVSQDNSNNASLRQRQERNITSSSSGVSTLKSPQDTTAKPQPTTQTTTGLLLISLSCVI